MGTFVIKETTHYDLLQPGKLYRVDAAWGDVVLGWTDDSFISMWDNHKGNLQRKLQSISRDIMAVQNMGLVLFCGAEMGHTTRDGNGTYFRFIYEDKVVIFSKKQILKLMFCDVDYEQ